MPVRKILKSVVGNRLKSNNQNAAAPGEELVDTKTISFDLFGCLLNYRMVTHFVGQLARDKGLNPEMAERLFNLYLERVRFSSEFLTYHEVLVQVMDYIDMEFNTSHFSANLDELYLIHSELEPHVDVLKCLNTLVENNYEIYLFANCDHPVAKRSLFKFDKLIPDRNVVTADDVRCYKPNIEFFKFADKKFDFLLSQHLHVTSDYFHDVIPALRMQWRVCYVNRDKTGLYAYKEPTIVINSLSELGRAMEQERRREIEARKAEEARLAAEAAEQERIRLENERRELEAQQRREARRMQQLQEQLAQNQAAQATRMGNTTRMLAELDRDDELIAGSYCNNPYFVPETEDDRLLVEKMRTMPSSKARAIANARKRALAHARIRDVYR